MKWLAILLLSASSLAAQTVNPNQIRPGSTNHQMLVTQSGVTQWSPLAGTYVGSVFNSNFGAIMDGCDPSTEFTFTNGRPDGYSAILGCINVPNSSTVLQGSGVAGMAIGDPGGSSTNVVGVYGSGAVKSGSGWGGNFLASSVNTSGSGVFLWGIEDDVNVNNTADEVRGLALIGAWNAQPSALGYAIDIQEPLATTGGPYAWNIGLQFETQSVGTAINFSPQNQASSQPSQKTVYGSFNSSAALLQGTTLMDSNGAWNWLPSVGSSVKLQQNAAILSTFNGGTSSFPFTGFEPALVTGNTISFQVGISSAQYSSANFNFGDIAGAGSVSNLATVGLQGGVSTNVDGAGNTYVASGNNVVFRCTTAGSLPVGAMTIVAADCTASTDTGLRVK